MKASARHILLPHDLVKEIDAIVDHEAAAHSWSENSPEAVRRKKLCVFSKATPGLERCGPSRPGSRCGEVGA